MKNSLLSLQGVSAGYGKDDVLKDISFGVSRGDFLGIIGPNGSGKSTLLRVMSRILSPHNGKVFFESANIQHQNLKDLCRRVAFVPQDTFIGFSYSVWEVVLMGRIPHLKRLQSETKKDRDAAQEALQLTDCVFLKYKNIDELSAGERQRVFIAKALAQQPVLLFLDEPTSHLDISHQIQILDLLRKLNKEAGLTIVIVLHDLNLASEYCRRLVLMEQGRICQDDIPEKVLTYQNIEQVYKTLVVVGTNPVTKKPCVWPVPRDKAGLNSKGGGRLKRAG